ncbi:M23 family metallopeptidase [Thermaerobacter sp. PB12/4term]|uniref:M23 family metallopeptidase n=1 Tax=Thermaerobacter sp. PB12/4term TaxID=2293838 RepID=UPI00193F8713|nr:M23 family metallopeptidase [Thermaerobacter sp. PB12/4term]
MANLSRWLNRINALLLAAWLGMVMAWGPGRAGPALGRPQSPDKPAWVAGLDALADRWLGSRSGLQDPGGPQPHGEGGAGRAGAGGAVQEAQAAGSPGPAAGGAGSSATAGAAQAPGATAGSQPGPPAIPPGRRWHPPVEGVATITSLFGPRDGRWHHGVDLAVPAGTPVRAVWAGQVRQAGWRGDYGLAVEVAHPGGWSTLYGHLESLAVERGQQVARGQLLGWVGATGNATGPHLHLEVRGGRGFFDPLAWLDPRWYRPSPALPGNREAGSGAGAGARGGS